ncbi:hypothetical protein DHEL01_v211521 [Diaporthe helianthi]|uniref:Uncharacterized protein n=1 Tax=Diaporthe helianthi TaxID=158607 RepID=A0A2P5HIK9_DIAHE|nr:hypothetical protein DHEL01_v211521 [Diaporthe helianthi]
MDSFGHGDEGDVLIYSTMDAPKPILTQALKQTAEGEKPALHVASCIRGQQMVIPSFDDIFQDWARNTNSGMMSNPKKLKKLEMDDYALCGAGMFMNAEFAPLCIMTFLTAWLFFFDDKVDNKDGELFGDSGQFSALTQQALDYAAYTLGLKDDYEEPEGGVDDFVGLFHSVGQALRGALCKATWLFDEAQVCMYTICSATEYASGVRLPDTDVLPVSELVQLWTEIRDLMIFLTTTRYNLGPYFTRDGSVVVTI